MTVHPRLQDLTRHEALAVSARVIQRAAPLIYLKEDKKDEVEPYFSMLFSFSRLLAELGMGSLSVESAKQQVIKFDSLLGRTDLFIKESMIAAMAISCVSDALADQKVEYLPTPGLAAEDLSNPDTSILVSHTAICLDDRGVSEDFIWHAVGLDCDFIFSRRPATESLVGANFFSRPLWPTPGLFIKDDGVPPAMKYALLPGWTAWLDGLGLSGIKVSFNACLQGMNLPQKKIRKEAWIVNNNVTITLGAGASWVGPVAAGENIRISYQEAGSTDSTTFREALEEVTVQVAKLTEKLESEDAKIDTSAQLAALVQEAKKEKPSQSMLKMTSNGLLETAKLVASMTGPVTMAVKAVLEHVGHH